MNKIKVSTNSGLILTYLLHYLENKIHLKKSLSSRDEEEVIKIKKKKI